MQPCKAFLFTFLIWAWEYTKNGDLNCNGDNDGVQNQFSVRAGRMLYEYDRLHNETDGSMTSLASADSIFSRSSAGSAGSVLSRSSAGSAGSVYSKSSAKRAFGNDFEGSIGTTSLDDLKSATSSSSTFNVDTNSEKSYDDDASETQSTTDESILVDLRDDNSVSSYNSGSTAKSDRTDVTKSSRGSTMSSSTRSSSAKSKKSKQYDTSYEDLESVAGKEVRRAKEKARRKELLDESTNNMKNRDDDNYEVSREETLSNRLKELNSLEKEAVKEVMKGSKKSKRRSKRRAKREGEFSGYLLNYKIAHRDDANFEVNQNERILRKVREFNAKDREQMRKTLNRIRKNAKNSNMEELEDEIKSQLESLRKFVNLDSDESSSVAGSTDESVYSDEDGSSIYVGKSGVETYGAKDRTKNNMTELRSYIDQAMDQENAEIAHLLVNKIEKYKNKVTKLKERNKKEVNFMNMRHNLKLKKVLLYVPLISLLTSVILGLLLTQYWALPVITAYFISLCSFVLGTLVSYGVMGKVMFNSAFKVVNFLLGKKSKVSADYDAPRRKKFNY
ncbi:Plasmodium exported protein, unknown function [Plasmodium vivax]|uniref:Pv-fam-d protein n=5 Tax=Plasmodium vivax TaxID=5855 RepID=A5KCA2_PLAVS|nr:hypothetical protein PVX_001670 [Plasmodium vivax]KMZ81650.1 hypothetical protein PVIIG_05017 [Plasmodium vivax India VII]KMZ87770.1 hypothetical protein PVBG_03871 [Plasmodium vivax Brazil I]KNA00833.1 hypothetical protein PVNG_04769 [Plasmodium vivax North Korean]EDL42966.1 hypothetical protein PVX_001670 [Plasmodium vivax]CAI7719111.1 Plasmodium exported protein, unknown function [Plasmodium vivax]|eukprot:XP_001612693.1 hypothetical protein [Plasmodium vivax Sal-1]